MWQGMTRKTFLKIKRGREGEKGPQRCYILTSRTVLFSPEIERASTVSMQPGGKGREMRETMIRWHQAMRHRKRKKHSDDCLMIWLCFPTPNTCSLSLSLALVLNALCLSFLLFLSTRGYKLPYIIYLCIWISRCIWITPKILYLCIFPLIYLNYSQSHLPAYQVKFHYLETHFLLTNWTWTNTI